ncbi:DUF397 domain-containing protein [Streptomyces sp. NPDC096057]|uniref:DUF397 domain-containing protein n=1 Tax=Streptomyces sp. NPDC096057 TaxID=3155543 RepID=UPI0033314C11
MIIPNSSAAGYAWTVSTYSGNQGDCVEVAHGVIPAALPVRDSKSADGPAVVFGATAWGALVDALKSGDVA